MSLTTPIHATIQEELVFCLSAAQSNHPCDSNLIRIVQQIYNKCNLHQTQLQGALLCTYTFDLSKKEIEIINTHGILKPLKKVKVYSFITNQICSSFLWKFEFIDNKIENYITSSNAGVIPIEFFNGLEHERIFPQNPGYEIVKKELWDYWEKSLPHAAKHYATVIYPVIISTINKVHNIHPQKMLDIIDLGGGSGRLAKQILKTLPEKVQKILVIDNSQELLAKASKRAKKYPEKFMTRQIDLNEDLLSLFALSQKADIITLCGVIAHQVLDKQTATKIISTCLPILRENGYIIAASLSPALLNSAEYKEMGLKVLNKSFTFSLDRGLFQPPYATNDFYILRKQATINS